MIIKNSFVVPLKQQEAWKVLLNIPDIASCVPGAEIVEIKDERNFTGRMNVKLGPVGVQFLGTVTFENVDDATYSATVKAKGSETKARGDAYATTRFSVNALSDDRSKVDIETDLTLSGMVAQYGRGAGMITALAQQIIDQFAACLSQRIQSKASSGADQGAPVQSPKAIGAFSLVFGAAWAWLRSLFGGARSDTGRGRTK